MSDRGASSLSRVWVVAQKELLDFVRDWRTLVALILIPLLLFPLIFIALPLFLMDEASELDQFHLTVEVQMGDGDIFPNELATAFAEVNLNWTIAEVPAGLANLSDGGGDLDRLRAATRDDSMHAILRLQSKQSNASEGWDFAVLYDSTQELSYEARNRMLTEINKWEDDIIDATLLDVGLTHEEALDPVHWDGDASSADVSTSSEMAGFALSMFIPMIVALWTASSAIQPSVDLTAGERERGTLEALLCTPAGRVELLYGKWVAVATVAGISVLFQLAGLLFAFTFLLPPGTFGIPALSIASLAAFLLSVILFAVFVVAIELALAVRAHSVKEAGTVLAPVLMLFIGPALFAQFVNLEGIEWWWFVAPVFNVCIAMRESLQDINDPVHILLWLSSSLLYAVVAVTWAARQFRREDLVESIS